MVSSWNRVNLSEAMYMSLSEDDNEDDYPPISNRDVLVLC